MTHTPGPWLREGNAVFTQDAENNVTFSAEVMSDLPGDARLISAAPELLTCLEGCIGYLMSLPNVQRPDPDWFKPASAAIAKATGS